MPRKRCQRAETRKLGRIFSARSAVGSCESASGSSSMERRRPRRGFSPVERSQRGAGAGLHGSVHSFHRTPRRFRPSTTNVLFFNRSLSSFSFSFSRSGENENDYENENEPDLSFCGCDEAAAGSPPAQFLQLLKSTTRPSAPRRRRCRQSCRARIVFPRRSRPR